MGLFSYSASDENLREVLRPVAEACVASSLRTGNLDDALETVAAHALSMREIWFQLETERGRTKADKTFVKSLTDLLIISGHRAAGRSLGSLREMDKVGRELLEMFVRPV